MTHSHCLNAAFDVHYWSILEYWVMVFQYARFLLVSRAHRHTIVLSMCFDDFVDFLSVPCNMFGDLSFFVPCVFRHEGMDHYLQDSNMSSTRPQRTLRQQQIVKRHENDGNT
eukprot:380035_1